MLNLLNSPELSPASLVSFSLSSSPVFKKPNPIVGLILPLVL